MDSTNTGAVHSHMEKSYIDVHSLDTPAAAVYNFLAMYIASSLMKGVGENDHSEL
jgi:hypothetical protein